MEEEEMSGGQESALQSALAALEQSKREAVSVAQEQVATVRDQWQAEVEGYKEQCQQHAITIVTLKEQLTVVLEEHEQLKKENKSLQQQFSDSTNPLEPEEKEEDDEEEELRSKMKEVEQTVKVLRHQLALSSEEGEKQTQTIQELREQMEHQKLIEEKLRAQHANELEDTRKTLSSQENELQRRNEVVERLETELRERQTELSRFREDHMKSEESLRESCETQLHTQLAETKEKWQRLRAVGERCLGEHHTQVLQRQSDTISHLREKLQKTCNDGRKPSDAGHVATLAELERVREELMEERAQRHLEASSRAGRRESDSDSTQEPDPVLDALELCEESYQELVVSVCETGIVKTRPQDERLPVTPSPDGRLSLMEDRKMFAEKVGKRIKSVLDQLEEMKEEAERGDGDCDTDEAGQPKPDLKAEVARLEEELETANEEIDQQKRINIALVKRQVFREQQMKKAILSQRHQQL